ncbi:formin frm3 [Cystoisospora suis]|uniref:Formin frm3 n=1 Tax=Cystoisospora suis TaxID=483139 RepID=A0A2C6L3G4_9APIC|nr:formin frm3 [Cystoisospora suis]
MIEETEEIDTSLAKEKKKKKGQDERKFQGQEREVAEEEKGQGEEEKEGSKHPSSTFSFVDTPHERHINVLSLSSSSACNQDEKAESKKSPRQEGEEKAENKKEEEEKEEEEKRKMNEKEKEEEEKPILEPHSSSFSSSSTFSSSFSLNPMIERTVSQAFHIPSKLKHKPRLHLHRLSPSSITSPSSSYLSSSSPSSSSAVCSPLSETQEALHKKTGQTKRGISSSFSRFSPLSRLSPLNRVRQSQPLSPQSTPSSSSPPLLPLPTVVTPPAAFSSSSSQPFISSSSFPSPYHRNTATCHAPLSFSSSSLSHDLRQEALSSSLPRCGDPSPSSIGRDNCMNPPVKKGRRTSFFANKLSSSSSSSLLRLFTPSPKSSRASSSLEEQPKKEQEKRFSSSSSPLSLRQCVSSTPENDQSLHDTVASHSSGLPTPLLSGKSIEDNPLLTSLSSPFTREKNPPPVLPISREEQHSHPHYSSSLQSQVPHSSSSSLVVRRRKSIFRFFSSPGSSQRSRNNSRSSTPQLGHRKTLSFSSPFSRSPAPRGSSIESEKSSSDSRNPTISTYTSSSSLLFNQGEERDGLNASSSSSSSRPKKDIFFRGASLSSFSHDKLHQRQLSFALPHREGLQPSQQSLTGATSIPQLEEEGEEDEEGEEEQQGEQDVRRRARRSESSKGRREEEILASFSSSCASSPRSEEKREAEEERKGNCRRRRRKRSKSPSSLIFHPSHSHQQSPSYSPMGRSSFSLVHPSSQPPPASSKFSPKKAGLFMIPRGRRPRDPAEVSMNEEKEEERDKDRLDERKLSSFSFLKRGKRNGDSSSLAASQRKDDDKEEQEGRQEEKEKEREGEGGEGKPSLLHESSSQHRYHPSSPSTRSSSFYRSLSSSFLSTLKSPSRRHAQTKKDAFSSSITPSTLLQDKEPRGAVSPAVKQPLSKSLSSRAGLDVLLWRKKHNDGRRKKSDNPGKDRQQASPSSALAPPGSYSSSSFSVKRNERQSDPKRTKEREDPDDLTLRPVMKKKDEDEKENEKEEQKKKIDVIQDQKTVYRFHYEGEKALFVNGERGENLLHLFRSVSSPSCKERLRCSSSSSSSRLFDSLQSSDGDLQRMKMKVSYTPSGRLLSEKSIRKSFSARDRIFPPPSSFLPLHQGGDLRKKKKKKIKEEKEEVDAIGKHRRSTFLGTEQRDTKEEDQIQEEEDKKGEVSFSALYPHPDSQRIFNLSPPTPLVSTVSLPELSHEHKHGLLGVSQEGVVDSGPSSDSSSSSLSQNLSSSSSPREDTISQYVTCAETLDEEEEEDEEEGKEREEEKRSPPIIVGDSPQGDKNKHADSQGESSSSLSSSSLVPANAVMNGDVKNEKKISPADIPPPELNIEQPPREEEEEKYLLGIASSSPSRRSDRGEEEAEGPKKQERKEKKVKMEKKEDEEMAKVTKEGEESHDEDEEDKRKLQTISKNEKESSSSYVLASLFLSKAAELVLEGSEEEKKKMPGGAADVVVDESTHLAKLQSLLRQIHTVLDSLKSSPREEEIPRHLQGEEEKGEEKEKGKEEEESKGKDDSLVSGTSFSNRIDEEMNKKEKEEEEKTGGSSPSSLLASPHGVGGREALNEEKDESATSIQGEREEEEEKEKKKNSSSSSSALLSSSSLSDNVVERHPEKTRGGGLRETKDAAVQTSLDIFEKKGGEERQEGDHSSSPLSSVKAPHLPKSGKGKPPGPPPSSAAGLLSKSSSSSLGEAKKPPLPGEEGKTVSESSSSPPSLSSKKAPSRAPPPPSSKRPSGPPPPSKAGGKGPPPPPPKAGGAKGGAKLTPFKAKAAGGARFLLSEDLIPKPPPGYKAVNKLQWMPLNEDKVCGTIFEDLLHRYPLSSSSSSPVKPLVDPKSPPPTAPPSSSPPPSSLLTVPSSPSPLLGGEVVSTTASPGSPSSSSLLLPGAGSSVSSSSPSHPEGKEEEEEREHLDDKQRDEGSAKVTMGKDLSFKHEEKEKPTQGGEEIPAVCNAEEASELNKTKKKKNDEDHSSSSTCPTKPSESLFVLETGGKTPAHLKKEEEDNSHENSSLDHDGKEEEKTKKTVVVSSSSSHHSDGQIEAPQEKTRNRRGSLPPPFRYRLDFAQIYRLFYVDEESLRKASKTGKSSDDGGSTSGNGMTGGGGGGGKKKLGVLDSKSSQNVEICLKKYKLSSLEDFKALTQEIDDPTTLSIDTNLADNITQYWPDASMKEALCKKTMDEVGAMPSADQLYYVLLTQISLAKEKLNFFIQRRAVDEELESKDEKFKKYSEGVKSLQKVLENETFLDLLSIMVRLGNCVNRGTKEGYGFKLKDFVNQMSSCISRDKSTNLFKVFVEVVVEQNPGAWEELSFLQHVDAAKGASCSLTFQADQPSSEEEEEEEEEGGEEEEYQEGDQQEQQEHEEAGGGEEERRRGRRGRRSPSEVSSVSTRRSSRERRRQQERFRRSLRQIHRTREVLLRRRGGGEEDAEPGGGETVRISPSQHSRHLHNRQGSPVSPSSSLHGYGRGGRGERRTERTGDGREEEEEVGGRSYHYYNGQASHASPSSSSSSAVPVFIPQQDHRACTRTVIWRSSSSPCPCPSPPHPSASSSSSPPYYASSSYYPPPSSPPSVAPSSSTVLYPREENGLFPTTTAHETETDSYQNDEYGVEEEEEGEQEEEREDLEVENTRQGMTNGIKFFLSFIESVSSFFASCPEEFWSFFFILHHSSSSSLSSSYAVHRTKYASN